MTRTNRIGRFLLGLGFTEVMVQHAQDKNHYWASVSETEEKANALMKRAGFVADPKSPGMWECAQGKVRVAKWPAIGRVEIHMWDRELTRAAHEKRSK